jgi:hypothetical protein
MACAVDTPLNPSGRRGLREAHHPIRCGGCARSYELRGWRSLALVRVLTGDAIAAHVIKWPLGVRIEVRRCARCAQSIARMVEPPRG